MEKKKRTVWHWVICVGLVCLIWGGYFITKHYGTDRIFEVIEDDFSWVYQVDEVGTEGENFVLQGFAFCLDEDARKGTFDIVLQDIESGERYFPKMKYVKRVDVNEYFLCENDYVQSGFKALFNCEKISLQERNFEVILKVKGKQEAFQTGTYLSKGKLMYVNPKEYRPLHVEGSVLEKIVVQGVLRVYRPDVAMYVYQYEDMLYWIAEQGYAFNEDGNTAMQYMLNTTQEDRLPLEQIEAQSDWDNRVFTFAVNEIREGSTNGYRVSCADIPKDYSITRIWTGKYSKGWDWRQDFRPYYRFK